MLFLSRDKSPSFLIIPGFEEIISTTHGNIPKVHKPVWLRFRPFGEGSGGMECPDLPNRRGENKALGSLSTESEAKRTKLDEQEIIEFLEGHIANGVEYVGVVERTEEDIVDDAFITPKGVGYYCQLCDADLKSTQAIAGHKTSNKHKAAFAAAIQAAHEIAKSTIEDK